MEEIPTPTVVNLLDALPDDPSTKTTRGLRSLVDGMTVAAAEALDVFEIDIESMDASQVRSLHKLLLDELFKIRACRVGKGPPDDTGRPLATSAPKNAPEAQDNTPNTDVVDDMQCRRAPEISPAERPSAIANAAAAASRAAPGAVGIPRAAFVKLHSAFHAAAISPAGMSSFVRSVPAPMLHMLHSLFDNWMPGFIVAPSIAPDAVSAMDDLKVLALHSFLMMTFNAISRDECTHIKIREEPTPEIPCEGVIAKAGLGSAASKTK